MMSPGLWFRKRNPVRKGPFSTSEIWALIPRRRNSVVSSKPRATNVGAKAPNLINLRIFDPREDKEYVGARLTVACGDIPILQATNFWPRPIYVRAWKFWLLFALETKPIVDVGSINRRPRSSRSKLMSCNPKSFENMKLLNICTFNARSIRNKMTELSKFQYIPIKYTYSLCRRHGWVALTQMET